MNILITVLAVVAAFATFRLYRKIKQERRELFDHLSATYNSSFESGDFHLIKNAALNLTQYKHVPQGSLNLMYEQCLTLLKKHPNLRPVVLEIGRKKYSNLKEKGSSKVYDESVIINEINTSL